MKKRIAVLIVTGLVIVGSLSAQGMPNPPAPQAQTVEKSTINGKLALVNGMIAVQSGSKTYYVRGFNHLIGFIDGLKEGATVTLEGYGYPIPNAPEYQYFMSTKLTFNGKSYDLYTGQGPGGMMHHNRNAAPPQNQMPQYHHNGRGRY